MADKKNDEAIAKHLCKLGLLTDEQIKDTLKIQANREARGERTSLGDLLIEQGLLTTEQRENIEKKLEIQRQDSRVIGPYRILKKLGEGGMGAVYLAEDIKTGKRVALKALSKEASKDKELVARFMREVDSARKLEHRNIVQAWEPGEDKGFHYYLMEYVEGETLGKRLRLEESFTPEEATNIVLQVAKGLRYAHGQGFIHRDIKPDNIIVSPKGVARILDMGLSKNIEEAQAFRTLTRMAIGTPHYIAPEQARGDKNIDGRVDIYSLGATYYHLITGETPYQGTTAIELIAQHLNKQIPDPRDVKDGIPDGVVHIIRRMMAKKPRDRYRDCGELITDLKLVKEGGNPSSQALDAARSAVALPMAPELRSRYRAQLQRRPPGTQRITVRRRPKRIPLIVGAASAGVGVVILLILLLASGSKPSPNKPVAPKKKPPPSVVKTPKVEPTPPKPPPKKAASGLQLLNVARQYVKDRPSDFPGQISRYTKAMWSLEERGSSHAATAQKELEEVRRRQWAALKPELDKLMASVEASESREEFSAALDLLKKSKGKHPGVPRWSNELGRKTDKIWSKMDEQIEVREARAVAARKKGAEEEVQTIKAQVAKWGSDKFSRRLEEALRDIFPEQTGVGVHELVPTDPKPPPGPEVKPPVSPEPPEVKPDPPPEPPVSPEPPKVEPDPPLEPPDSPESPEGKPEVKRAEVPQYIYRRKAEVKVRQIFDLSGARTAQAKSDMARQLVDTAASCEVGSAEQYVLLSKARDMAADALDIETALEAISAIGAAFEVDAVSQKVDLLTETQVSEESAGPLARACLDVATEAVKADAYEEAAKVAARAAKLARGAKDKELLDTAENRSKELESLKRTAFRLNVHFKTLEKNPEAPLANGEVGAFRCFVRNDWERGLPMLAKGLDEDLRKLAEKDLSNPGESTEQAALGEAWAARLKRVPSTHRAHLRERAALWLDRALPGLEGLAKVNAEKMIASLRVIASSGGKTVTLDLGGGVSMEMAHVNPGAFMMGGTDKPVHSSHPDSRLMHLVKITKDFYIGRTEVTRGQFAEFVKATGYKTVAELKGDATGRRSDGIWGLVKGANWKNPVNFKQNDHHPVVCVSWNDAVAFCKWASDRIRREVRLPTEAEWEYACRAGTMTRWHFGDDGDVLGAYAWTKRNSGRGTHPVGLKRPNPWGLYDMYGNVWELCQDLAGPYSAGLVKDPTGPSGGNRRCARGGDWGLQPTLCNSAYRGAPQPLERSVGMGFRVVLR